MYIDIVEGKKKVLGLRVEEGRKLSVRAGKINPWFIHYPFICYNQPFLSFPLSSGIELSYENGVCRLIDQKYDFSTRLT